MRGLYNTEYKLGDFVKTYNYNGNIIMGTVTEIILSQFMTKYKIITKSNDEILLNADEIAAVIE